MSESFVVPANFVRAGDTINVDGQWVEVIDSSDAGIYMDGESEHWRIKHLISQENWDWSKYDTYGRQPNEDRWDENDPKWYVPEDCQDYFDLPGEAPVEIYSDGPEILHPETLLPIRWWVNVYEVDRAYGGPEEGGWWFDTGELLLSVPCSDLDNAEDVFEKLREKYPSNGRSSSVIYDGGDFSVRVQTHIGKSYPENSPRYC